MKKTSPEVQNNASPTRLLLSLRPFLPLRRLVQLWLVAMLMCITALLEVFSISLVFPFISLLVKAQTGSGVFEFEIFGREVEFLISPLQMTVAFASAAVLSNISRTTLLWSQTRLSYAIARDLSSKVFETAIYQKYEWHVSSNTSETINNITYNTNAIVNGVIRPSLMLLTSIPIFLSILIFLLTLEFQAVLIMVSILGASYWTLSSVSKNVMMGAGRRSTEANERVIRCVQEGLGGIRDTIINRSHLHFLSIHRESESISKYNSGTVQIVAELPRFGIEAIALSVLAVVAYFLSIDGNGVEASLPFLAAFALGAQRLLPLAQSMYACLSNIRAGTPPLQKTLDVLDMGFEKVKTSTPNIRFQKEIKFQDVSFSYHENGPPVLDSLNLVLSTGKITGIVGPSGSGKSTFLDLLMGLLTPDSGKIYADATLISPSTVGAWQSNISHVSQSTFITNTTIRDNICFGQKLNDIDALRLDNAIQIAQLKDFVRKLPDGVETKVGERGKNLSGGQVQRIGIARALYRKSEILVLDEATSALDIETENKLLEAIRSLVPKQTLVFVTHRENTLKMCDVILNLAELDNMRISR